MLVDCYTTRGFAIYASVLVRFTMIARIAARLNCARIAQCDSHTIRKKISHKQALYKPYKPTNHHLEHTCCAHCVLIVCT